MKIKSYECQFNGKLSILFLLNRNNFNYLSNKTKTKKKNSILWFFFLLFLSFSAGNCLIFCLTLISWINFCSDNFSFLNPLFIPSFPFLSEYPVSRVKGLECDEKLFFELRAKSIEDQQYRKTIYLPFKKSFVHPLFLTNCKTIICLSFICPTNRY